MGEFNCRARVWCETGAGGVGSPQGIVRGVTTKFYKRKILLVSEKIK